jgi:hypothetical protein
MGNLIAVECQDTLVMSRLWIFSVCRLIVKISAFYIFGAAAVCFHPD